ncbi:hypothetical protein A0H81_03860 [Grifola frondosa]|uniref:Uncharacterized protein n=1 Tax=Grifola frondosa TaxID=5627 RepID=A0A1C7MJZ4_GRIFR|nr:hypothetical protein A0H81_03860 [Grifola frondosa]
MGQSEESFKDPAARYRHQLRCNPELIHRCHTYKKKYTNWESPSDADVHLTIIFPRNQLFLHDEKSCSSI